MYIPFRVGYVSKQMRVRLIPHSFYIIFSDQSEFEVEKLGKVYGELKKGVQELNGLFERDNMYARTCRVFDHDAYTRWTWAKPEGMDTSWVSWIICIQSTSHRLLFRWCLTTKGFEGVLLTPPHAARVHTRRRPLTLLTYVQRWATQFHLACCCIN